MSVFDFVRARGDVDHVLSAKAGRSAEFKNSCALSPKTDKKESTVTTLITATIDSIQG